MKYIFLLLTIISLFSCGSDNLSNSKAEDIIEDCLENEPLQGMAQLPINKSQIPDSEIEKYKKLEEDGLIELEEIKAEQRASAYANYNIKLTSKGKRYILEENERYDYVIVNTFKYVVDEVLEVQEFPAMNTAKVKVQYEADDITPFAILSFRPPSDYWVKDLTMKKTSNGWKYCDDY